MKLKRVIESDINLFLDTTIQIDRKLGETKKLEKILKQAKSLCTSTYVKMEYRRSLIQDFVFIFNVLSEVENFGELLLRIKGLSPQTQRRMNRMIGGLARFFIDKEKKISESLGKEFIEIAHHYFKPIIEFSMEDFDDSVDSVVNETNCYNAKKTPLLEGKKFDNRTVHCKTKEIKCKIIEFFERNINEFKKIWEELSRLQNLDNEQEKMKRTLEKALKHHTNMADYRNCWRCADLIIALECPQNAFLCTTNVKHFEPICEKIGKRLASLEY